MTAKQKKEIIEYINSDSFNMIYFDKEIEKLKDKFIKNQKFRDEEKTTTQIKIEKFIFNEVSKHILKFQEPCKAKYSIKENRINSAIVFVLEHYLLNNINKEVPSAEFYGDFKNDFKSEYGLNENADLSDYIKKSLNYIKCLLLAEYRRDGRFTFYKLNIDKWFEYNRYYIANKEALKVLLPLLVAYLKSEKNCSIGSFFEKIADFIKYLLQPYENTNYYFYIEHNILEDIEADMEMEIEIFDKNSKARKPFNTIDIKPKRIIFNDDYSRSVEYIDSKGNVRIIDIKDIRSITVDEDTKGAIQLQGGTKYYLVNEKIDLFNIDKQYKEEKKYQIILEVPTSLFEYFQTKPLSNQIMFHTSQMIKQFEEFYNINDTKESYFYIVAEDTILNAASIVLYTLDNIKIIEPSILTDAILEKIEQFKLKH